MCARRDDQADGDAREDGPGEGGQRRLVGQRHRLPKGAARGAPVAESKGRPGAVGRPLARQHGPRAQELLPALRGAAPARRAPR